MVRDASAPGTQQRKRAWQALLQQGQMYVLPSLSLRTKRMRSSSAWRTAAGDAQPHVRDDRECPV